MVDVSGELRELAERLPELGQRDARLADFFSGAGEVVLARAPGRLDVMGGIADYSGSLVLERPIREAARVAVARTDDGRVRIASLGANVRLLELEAATLFEACRSLAELRSYLESLGAEARFAAYLIGGLPWLTARGATLGGGLRLLLDSAVPEGAGVSSSAAIEVAALHALATLFEVPATGPELGLACQAVENRVVGAACGVMDQMTSACGRADHLLALLCQPAELRAPLALPDGLEVFGIDSGVRHAVSGPDYTDVRVAAFMGLRILAERLGAGVRQVAPGKVELEQDALGGYLANLPPSAVDEPLRAALPESMQGGEFVARFGGISDPVTTVDSARTYRVREATLHPIYEHARVAAFASGLETGAGAADFRELGQLMLASHASYTACGLGSDATDRLVHAVEARAANGRLFGAKITGGGCGGTVAILGRAEALPDVRRIAEEHGDWLGRPVDVFSGSSPGAAAFPAWRERL